jgi:hypothetical protein
MKDEKTNKMVFTVELEKKSYIVPIIIDSIGQSFGDIPIPVDENEEIFESKDFIIKIARMFCDDKTLGDFAGFKLVSCFRGEPIKTEGKTIPIEGLSKISPEYLIDAKVMKLKDLKWTSDNGLFLEMIKDKIEECIECRNGELCFIVKRQIIFSK